MSLASFGLFRTSAVGTIGFAMIAVSLAAAGPADAAAANAPGITASALSALEENATVSSGTPTFSFAGAVRDGASTAQAQLFADGVRAGGGIVTGEPSDLVKNAVLAAPLKAAKCGGVTKETSNWAGHTIYLNSCDATTAVGILNSGAGITGFLGFIFSEVGVGIPLAALAGVAAVYAGWITASNNRNQGVELHEPYVGVMTVSSQ